MRAAVAERWRTGHDHVGNRFAAGLGHSQGSRQQVGVQFPVAGQRAVQAAQNLAAFVQIAADQFFVDRIAFFHHQDLVAFGHHLLDRGAGDRILADFQYRVRTLAVGVVFHQVVVADTAGNDTQALVAAVFVAVETVVEGACFKIFLLGQQLPVEYAGVGGQQDETLWVRIQLDFVLAAGFAQFNPAAGVRHTGGYSEEDRRMQFFGKVERIADHVVGFLLIGRFQAGNLGKAGVIARILFVLGGVHRGVVGNQIDQTAVGTSHRRVGEGVGGHVQTYVLHAHQGSAPGVGNADGFFHRGLFVGAPGAVDAFFLGQLGVLDR